MKQEFGISNYESKITFGDLQDYLGRGKLSVRIRNLGELNMVKSLKIGEMGVRVVTNEPIFGVAEGQAAVLYARVGQEGEEIVVAGGEIGLV